MKTILLSIFCALISFSAFAQEKKDSLVLIIWPCDAFTMKTLMDSTNVELLALDSTFIAKAEPAWNHHIPTSSHFRMPVGVRSGEFLLRVTNPNYQTRIKKISFKAKKKDWSYNLGSITMRRMPKSRKLGEAVVTATKIKFYTKNDTLIFNADAFNLTEGSMLDALVEQLPGAELKRDGRIYMNGKLVESLLLNGKDFFKGDNEILLDNLPAYTVKHVKFYDKKSELSEELKMDLNDSRFVMDVELKREYSIGWLTNAEAGGGTHDRWLGRMFALRFTPQSRLTFFANANNTNENRKPGRNGDWSPYSMGNGTSTTESGGFDYYIDAKRDGWKVGGSINASHSDNDSETLQNGERYQTLNTVFKRNHNVWESKSTSVSTSHDLDFYIGSDNDYSRLRVYPSFNYSYSKNMGDALSAEFSANPIGEGNWENIFDGPNAGKDLMGILINKVRTRQKGNSENFNGGINTRLYFDMPITNKRMTLTAGFKGGRSKSNSFDLYNLSYAKEGKDDNRHRYFHSPSDNLSANAGLSWGYFLFHKGFHSISLFPSLDYGYSHSKKENSQYRLDRLEEMADADFGTLPSTQEALLSTLDRANSYITITDDHQVSASLQFGYSYDVREDKDGDEVRTALWRLTIVPGVTMSSETFNFDGLTMSRPERTSWLPTMNIHLQRNTPGMLLQYDIDFSYSQQLPSLFNLMGMRFDSDPLNISEGNAGLRKTEVFKASLGCMPERWGQKEQRRLSWDLTATFYRNSVATAQFYDEKTGVRTYRPQNINGNYNIDFEGNFTTPLDPRNRRFTLDVDLYNYFYRSVDLQSTNSPTPVRSIVYRNYFTIPVRISYSYKKLTIGVNGQLAWNTARSKRENFQNINGYHINAGMYGNVRLPWDFQLATDLTFFARRGYANAMMNKDNIVWNAQLSKSILKGSLTFALVGYDILNDISNLSYSVNTQGYTETWRNAIPSYGMLRIMYKFNKHPKKTY